MVWKLVLVAAWFHVAGPDFAGSDDAMGRVATAGVQAPQPAPQDPQPQGRQQPLTLPPAVREFRHVETVPQHPAGVDLVLRNMEAQRKADADMWATTMRSAIATDAWLLSEAQRLANERGQSLELAKKDLEFLRRLDALRRAREDRIRSTNPTLYQSMEGLEHARLEHARTSKDSDPTGFWLGIAALVLGLTLVLLVILNLPLRVAENGPTDEAPADSASKAGLEAVASRPEPSSMQGWWTTAGKGTRAWTFVSGAWFLAVLVVVFVFDPMHYHNWTSYSPNPFFAWCTAADFIQLAVVCLLPPLAWTMHRMWLKLVVGPSSKP